MAAFGQNLPDIACCLCGSLVKANGANMCLGCLGEKYNICTPLEEINPEILMCKKCGKWRTKHGAGKGTKNETWGYAELESQELMNICLKQGIEHTLSKSGLQLVNANFEWTEPHSRRLKVRVVVRKHISELPNGGVTLQGMSTVQIVIKTRQCNECAAENSTGGGEPWRVCVQMRQRVSHKKTLLLLEQEAISDGVISKCLGIEQMKDGLDLYFLDMPTATKFCDWAKAKVPMRSKLSKKLVSTDVRSNLNHFKHTMVLEIVPLCKDDLVFVSKQSPLRNKLAGLHLVTKVASILKLVQVYPPSFRMVELTAEQFFRCPFEALMSTDALIPFTLLDDGSENAPELYCDNERDLVTQGGGGGGGGDNESVFSNDGSNSLFRGSEVRVARGQDLGLASFACHTHLSGVRLGVTGDNCLGYDLESRNLGEDFLSTFSDYPSVVLVKREKVAKTRQSKKSTNLSGRSPETHQIESQDSKENEEEEGEVLIQPVKLSGKEKRKAKREAKRAMMIGS